MKKISKFLSILTELTKFRITFFVSVTTFVGYIIHNGGVDINIILPTIGVLVLACGASSLNEWQERNYDSKMNRTNSRPIPSGRLSPNNALIISLLFILAGSILLSINSLYTMLLGLFTLLWYNAVYTPLKQKTAIAILPGSLVGALPPVIGWVASGGSIIDPKILALASFMFIWQIPHFWLLLLMYDDQYKEAGFPTLSKIFTFNQITKITFLWISILVFSSIVFYFSGLSITFVSNILLLLAGLTTLFLSYSVIKAHQKEIFGKKFLLINAYVLLVLIVISIENII
ncbi:MAG: protoheme IX farnesyltransferase [Melioribacteraceae bacterium]|nr:protoheme IX farnesyltransferase [Melioribacteraceae bacterium]